jgi:hypothetical protein
MRNMINWEKGKRIGRAWSRRRVELELAAKNLIVVQMLMFLSTCAGEWCCCCACLPVADLGVSQCAKGLSTARSMPFSRWARAGQAHGVGGGDDAVDAEADVVDERDKCAEAARHGGATAQGRARRWSAGVSPWCARRADLRLPWLSLVPN